MLSCRKATELIEKRNVTKLSMTEKVQLRLHTSMCSGCAAYQKQSTMIDQWLHQHYSLAKPADSTDASNTELKEKIISKLSDMQ